MTELTNALKGELKAKEKRHICFKEVSSEIRKVRDHCHYTCLY